MTSYSSMRPCGHGRGLALALALPLLTGSAMAQEDAPAGPTILRGSVAVPPPVVEPAAGPPASHVVAGERLWIVDEAAGRLTGCRLVGTSRVGQQAIFCTERPLP